MEDNPIFSKLPEDLFADDDPIFYLKVLNTLKEKMKDIEPSAFTYSGNPAFVKGNCLGRYIYFQIGEAWHFYIVSVRFEHGNAMLKTLYSDRMQNINIWENIGITNRNAEKALAYIAGSTVRFINNGLHNSFLETYQ